MFKTLLIGALLGLASGSFAQDATKPTDTASSLPSGLDAPTLATDKLAALESGQERMRLYSELRMDVALDKGRKLYAEVPGSERWTIAFQSYLTQNGHTLVANKRDAEVIYTILGVFDAVRPITGRTSKVGMSEFADKPKGPGTKRDRGFQFNFHPAGVIQTIVGSVVATAGDSIGLHDSFNSLFGDPDGVCMYKCERWEYIQAAAVTFKRTEGTEIFDVALLVETKHKDLRADHLFRRAAKELSERTGMPEGLLYAPVSTKSQAGPGSATTTATGTP